MGSVFSRTALLAGLAALVPVPLIDELLRRFVLSRAIEEMARQRGRPLPDGAGWALSKRRSNILVGCLLAVFWWPVKKLFRTVLYFLTVKDAIDWGADAAIRLAMVRRALDRGLLPDHPDAVWKALDDTADAHVGSPVTRGKAAQDPGWDVEPSGLDAFITQLARSAGAHDAMVAYDQALDALDALGLDVGDAAALAADRLSGAAGEE